jgi:hypothetical protein
MAGYMRAIAWLLRVFCYLFHTLLSLSLLMLGTVATASSAHTVKVETLSWQGAQLNHWMIGLGIAGLLSVLLAATGKLRLLLPLWSAYVLVVLVKGVFLSSTVSFDGPSDFQHWLWLIGGAVLALLGSFSVLSDRGRA